MQYIECAEDGYESQRSLCRKKNIEGYPTWEIGGKYVFGERSLEELAEISGFRSWPKPPAKPPPLKEGDVVPEVL